MADDPRSQEEKDKAWREQVFDEMHSSVPEDWMRGHKPSVDLGFKPCPVCGRPMQIVAGIGTTCKRCGPYWPNHDYSDLSERPWTDWREGGEEIGY